MKNSKKSKVRSFLAAAIESAVLFIFFALLAAYAGQNIFAVSFNCSIVSSSSCTGTGNITVFKLMNETNGFWNAHAQNASIAAGYNPSYNYSVCCFSDGTLSISQPCTEANVLKFSNWTNAHVQQSSYSSGLAYSYSSCLSVEPGTISCNYSSSCSASQVCLASMASSNASAANQTDSHVGACTEYATKICCGANSPPVISNVVLNSTYGTNYTHENLTVYFSETDADGDSVTNITDWRKEGKSIAVLNMPFNTNISANTSGAVKDYTTFSNNGTLGGITIAQPPTWVNNGKVGGAYRFDGNVSCLWAASSSGDELDPQNAISFGGWININGSKDSAYVIAKGWGDAYELRLASNNKVTLGIYHNATSSKTVTSNAALNNGVWHHIFGVYDRSTIKIYINGTLDNSDTYTETIAQNAFRVGVGCIHHMSFDTYFGNGFNGSIDEVQIFNYSLSANQIKAMYQAGVENHSVQTIHSDETTKYENWSVVLTPNDGLNDGTPVTSNTLNIRNSLPFVNLTLPTNMNYTRLRTPAFYWNATDYDGDVISYQINITAFALPSPLRVCSDDILNYSGVMNFTPTNDLSCFYDNNYQYNWSVRANDSEGYGNWSSVWTFNMTAVVDMSMPVSSVAFGSIALGGYNDTTTNSPPPLKIQNDGNALININVTSTSLWQTVLNPTNYYRFKINTSEEANSFNWTLSATSWTQFPLFGNNASGIFQLRYQDANDSAVIDIYVEVPPAEPPGYKNTTITFLSILGE